MSGSPGIPGQFGDQRAPPKIVYEEEDSSEEEEEEEDYDDGLNKTLPPNFKFRHKSQPVMTSSMLHPTHQSRSSPMHTPPQDGEGSPNNRSGTGLRRSKPVDSSQKPNWSRYRERQLGKSDPSLSPETATGLFSPEESFEDHDHESELADHLSAHLRLPPSRTQSLNQPKSPRSPRISSPSPCGSPRTWSPSITNFERFSHGRRSEMRNDMRRWSLVSQSSGYTTYTSATDSPASLSSYPSQEHIHAPQDHTNNQLPTTPTPEDFAKLRKHFRSDSSGSSSIHVDDDLHIATHRLRARSLSPERSPRESLLDLDDTHAIFREKYPRAKLEMENQLVTFMNEFSETNRQFSDSNVNFARHQILEFARELLFKSQNDLLSKEVFIQFSENVLQAVTNVRERNGAESPELNQLVRKLLTVISRVARLVEIIEFDPNAFSASVLQLAGGEGGAKGEGGESSEWLQKLTSSHMPYILNRLNQTLENNDGDSAPKLSKERPSSLHLSLDQIQPRKEDFDVIKIISNGAYGAVYLVRHKQTRMRFAMKKVNKKRMIMKKQVQSVFNERDILTFSENPFVVGLWCTFQTRQHLYMVMEYVEGGDVAALLKGVGYLTLELATMYFSETVLALEYIHSHGIIHRDLKPDNLLITSEGHIKLTDFGLSKIGLTNYAAHVIEDAWAKDYQFVDQEVYGTPDYIAPEVILGMPYGFPVDWWSMGVILYEMMMGVTPFVSSTIQDLFEEITNENLHISFPEEDEIPDDAQDLVRQLMCFDPMYRLGSTAREGVSGVKSHPFFSEIDWNLLLRTKAEFIPQLRGDDDTSYFDTRENRYPQNEFASDEEPDGDTDQPFDNFSSTAPRMYLNESFRISLTDSTLGLDGSKEANRDSGIVEQEPATSILEKPVVNILNETSESGGVEEDEEEEGPITNIDDFDEEPSTNTILADLTLRGTRTPLAITHSYSLDEREHPHSPSSNDERPIVSGSTGRSSKYRPSSGERMKSKSRHHQLSNIAITSTSLTPGDGSPSSPRNSMAVTPIVIANDRKGYGMTLKPIRVYIGDSNNYRIHHIVQSVDKDGPAYKAGLRPNMLVTHINGEAVTGLQHVQVVSLMFKNSKKDASAKAKDSKEPKHKRERENSILTIHTIPLDQTSIKQDSRKRIPWLGRRIGKILRKHSSRVKKRPSFFRRGKMRSVDTTSQSFTSSFGSGSPKLSSSPRRAESMKDRVRQHWRKSGSGSTSSKHGKTPVSPLARSTSPVALSSVLTPNSSPPGSVQNLSSTTPPNSPPTTHKERHSMFAESSLLTHTKKSVSSSELFLSTAATKKNSSPHTSPLLKRAVSPSPEQTYKVSGSGGGSGGKTRKFSTLERSTIPRTKKDSVSFIM
ncbi:PREDICTED: microtubule-associated serine/threonine-protein kinase 3-like isoform X1 [Amphimedon queenslandica]|uniref:non-specific serine/threonine protein kinase n=2 Tax=Amphimedon queenslandica TaxID=400682 RepID=A0A1X7V3A1_AMPQE|nr:PREDICTED: microtubule-associated serine/threonine-protein kinase 3-like isoform X1 [Amphimedon queenslandica]|eukprot:XP_019850933.1 PREDICTED: microtubule-associated serine/threonine-protein kinase 3-like isoform X1 [Amphimedon queenslandica]